MAEGIEVRVARDGTRTYRASVWSNRERKRIRKSFAREAEAKAWRQDAARAVRTGRMRAAAAPTLGHALDAWKAGAEAGTIRTIVAVEQNYRLRLGDAFGAAVADSAKDALDQVSPNHPDRETMRKFTSSVHRAAGRRPVWTAS